MSPAAWSCYRALTEVFARPATLYSVAGLSEMSFDRFLHAWHVTSAGMRDPDCPKSCIWGIPLPALQIDH